VWTIRLLAQPRRSLVRWSWLDLHVRLGGTGAHLVLAAPTAQVRRVLGAASLHETLATAPSIAEAMGRLSPSDAASPSHRLPDGLRQLRLHR
jgi:hypothetical protein